MSEYPLTLLLLAYGAPQNLGEVEDFLGRVMGPSRVTPEIVERAHRRYRALGGGSPLVANTRRQAAALERRLQEQLGPGSARVLAGMRYSQPFLEEALTQALETGGGRVLALIMASHQSRQATGGYQKDVQACLERRRAEGSSEGEVVFPPAWHTHQLYVEAVADRVRDVLPDATAEEEERLVVFTAHSLPMAEGGEGDPDYERGLAETAAAVMTRLPDLRWRLAYQSRSPRPGVRWLGPDVAAVLEEEASAGVRSVVVAPLGFVAEHLETLYDLDIELRERAAALGLGFARAATVQDHPLFIDALADIATRHGLVGAVGGSQ